MGITSPNKVARIAGSGTWDGETKKTEIRELSSGGIIGTKKMLSYVLNSDLGSIGGWIVHEYSLAGAFLNEIKSTDYVFCRIIWDESKNTKDLWWMTGNGSSPILSCKRQGPACCHPRFEA
ncbi:hypothetical protein ACH5RR_036310 [Cinchona calisaya]|uniref:NAC domain-containing protein n=1 Tax=Cinchona calisaya TaxID=153742 RepID=A0ABD2Y2T6_9GENT